MLHFIGEVNGCPCVSTACFVGTTAKRVAYVSIEHALRISIARSSYSI